MLTAESRTAFDTDGFVVLPGYLSSDELSGALTELSSEFPTPEQFHEDVEPVRNQRFKDEFGGISPFPLAATALNLLSVHPRLIDLARLLLQDDDLRSYSIEFWAKYTGAANYGQAFHRDYLDHTLLVPAPEDPPSQVEMFVYLSDVSADLGPVSLLPRHHSQGVPALPNWYPPTDGHSDPMHHDWVAGDGRPEWYEMDVRATGPAGTVIAYRIDTFHRGTNLKRPGGHRFTIHTNFRRASHDWVTRRAWVDRANDGRAWADFVAAASPRQLALFGFPQPGHPFWTPATLAGLQQRYPGVDIHAWQ